MPSTGLAERFNSAAKKLRADFDASANTTHRESRGTEREEILTNFLRLYISRNVEVVHKAEIITSSGESSPACDLVIIDKSASVLQNMESHHIVMAESVYGVIEVKSDLTGPSLRDDCGKIRAVKVLPRAATATPIFGIIFGYDSITMKYLGLRFIRWCDEQESAATDPDGVWVLDRFGLRWGPVGGANDNFLRAETAEREVRGYSRLFATRTGQTFCSVSFCIFPTS